VFFREIPWQMLMLSCPTVAHASGSESSVFFRVYCFCLFRVFPCSSVANAYSSACSSFRGKSSAFATHFVNLLSIVDLVYLLQSID